ncbi:MAG: hypothetical protein ABSG43_28840 [Solirubrobacteraceae bacterium]|jgi:hypothetical protein
MTDKPATRARANKPTSGRKPKALRKPDQDEISTRAYFMHLHEDQSDQLGNLLRAEHELTAA